MKGFLRAEIFGDDFQQKLKIVRAAFNDALPGAHLGDQEFRVPSSTWCAEILGTDPKYRYKRKFIRGKKDYSIANGKGSRGLYYEWILESGHIYEVKEQLSWSRTARYFCTVDNDGNVVNLSEEDASKMFKKIDDLNKMTDNALLDYVASLKDNSDSSINESDAVMDILKERHGKGEADRMWSERFGGPDA